MDPTGLSASISLIFGIAKFCLDLSEVTTESLVFCRLIERVYINLQKTIRLLGHPVVQTCLETDEEERKYIHGNIKSTKLALAGIGQFVEAVRLDASRNGTISLQNRANWVLTHQSKLSSRQKELDICHTSLLQSMSRMESWIDRPILPSYEATVGVADGQDYVAEELLSPYKRRKAREITKKHSVASIENDLHAVRIDAKPLPPLPSNSTVSHQAQSPSLEGGNIQPLDLEIIEPLSYHASPVPTTLEVTKTQSQGGDLSSKRYHTPQNSTPGTYSTSLTNVTLPLNSAAAVDLPLRTNECEATQPHNQATRSLGDNGPVETFPPLPLHSPQWTDRNAETQHTERRLREPSVSSMSTGILSPTFSPMAQSVASLTSSQDTNNATGHYNPGAYGTVEPVTGSPYRSQAQDAYRPGAYGAVELESNLPRQLNLAIRPKTIAWNDYQPGAYGAVELQSNPQSQLRLPVPLRDENTPQTRNLAAATEILTHPPSPPATKIPEVGGGTISRGLPESNVLSSSTSGKAPASQSLPTDASGLIRPGSSEDRRKRRARLQLISGDP